MIEAGITIDHHDSRGMGLVSKTAHKYTLTLLATNQPFMLWAQVIDVVVT